MNTLQVDTQTAINAASYVRSRLQPPEKATHVATVMMEVARKGAITEQNARRIAKMIDGLQPEEDADEASAMFIDALTTDDPPESDSQYPDVTFPERVAPRPTWVVSPDGTIRGRESMSEVLATVNNPWRHIVNQYRSNGENPNAYTIGVLGDCSRLASIKINTGYSSDHISLPEGQGALSMSFVGIDGPEQSVIPGLQFDTQYGLNQDIGAYNLAIRRPAGGIKAGTKGHDVDGEFVLSNVEMLGGPGGYGDGKWMYHGDNIKTRIFDNVRNAEGIAPWEWDGYGHFEGDVFLRGCKLGNGGRGGDQQVSRNSEVPNHHTIYESGLVYVEGCTHSGKQHVPQGGAVISCYSADTLIVKDCDFQMTGKTKGCAALYEARDMPKTTDGHHVRLAIYDGNKVTGDGDARTPLVFSGVQRGEIHNLKPGDVVAKNTAWELILGSDFSFNQGAPEMKPEQVFIYSEIPADFRIGIFDYGTRKMRDATAEERAVMQRV